MELTEGKLTFSPIRKYTSEIKKLLLNPAENEQWWVDLKMYKDSFDLDSKHGKYFTKVYEEDEFVAACTFVIFADILCVCTHLIVEPHHRKNGKGTKVFKIILEQIESQEGGTGLTYELVCADDMIKFYEKFGYAPYYRINCYKSFIPLGFADEPDMIEDIILLEKDCESDNLKLVIEYDSKIVGFSREAFIEPSVKKDNVRIFTYIKDDVCKGFITGVEGDGCLFVQIIYADNDEIFKALLIRLMEQSNNSTYVINLDTENPYLKSIEKFFDLKDPLTMTVMRKGVNRPRLASDKCIGSYGTLI